MIRTASILITAALVACSSTSSTDAGTEGGADGGCVVKVGVTCQNPDMTCDAPFCMDNLYQCMPGQKMVALVPANCAPKDAGSDAPSDAKSD